MGKDESQPVDEEALLRQFGTSQDDQAETAETEDATVDAGVSESEYLTQVRVILDHPTFRQLGSSEQILYLQLHRHCQGLGKNRLWASIAEMSHWTQRAAKNVCQTLRRLRQRNLVTLNVRPRPFHKGQYQIHPLRESPAFKISALEMSNRIDHLQGEERSTLDQQIASLSASETRDLRQQAQLLVRDLSEAGFTPLPSVEEKAFRYLAYMKTTGIWRIAERFPDWLPR